MADDAKDFTFMADQRSAETFGQLVTSTSTVVLVEQRSQGREAVEVTGSLLRFARATRNALR